jgi:predicted amidophosphoribosyltransferase
MTILTRIKNLISDLFFPKFCFNCQREGDYLCPDCQAMLEISGQHRISRLLEIDDLYWASDYNNPLIYKLVQSFKNEPIIKDLSKTLSFLIQAHLQLLDERPDFSEFILVPIPLGMKKLKWRGFNQAEEIAKELTDFLKIPVRNVLIKKDNNLFCSKPNEIKENNIILIDDYYLSGATMAECAKVLKGAGAKKIIGLVAARGENDKQNITSAIISKNSIFLKRS